MGYRRKSLVLCAFPSLLTDSSERMGIVVTLKRKTIKTTEESEPGKKCFTIMSRKKEITTRREDYKAEIK
jgi:hypothetical protein